MIPLAVFTLAFMAAAAADPGISFIGATFRETFDGVGELGAEVVGFTPPAATPPDHVEDVETRGLYKVLYSDGDHAQLYYTDLLKRGAALPKDAEEL